MIHGIEVELLVANEEIGKDRFNVPIYSDRWETVRDVLVAPTSSEDIINISDVEGSKTLYTLAIPKKDNHDWHGCRVRFFGYTWKAFGEPIKGIDANIPLRWNTKVVVERVDKAK